MSGLSTSEFLRLLSLYDAASQVEGAGHSWGEERAIDGALGASPWLIWDLPLHDA